MKCQIETDMVNASDCEEGYPKRRSSEDVVVVVMVVWRCGLGIGVEWEEERYGNEAFKYNGEEIHMTFVMETTKAKLKPRRRAGYVV